MSLTHGEPAATGAVPTTAGPLAFRVIMWTLLGGLLISVIGGAAYQWHKPPTPRGGWADHLPHIAGVPGFSLVERSGRPVSLGDLRGTVWVANFIFTNCAGPCPVLSRHMKGLQKDFADYHPYVKLISFTLDPERDTPERLQWYASLYDADPARWWFLTGPDEAAIHSLVARGFLQTVQPETEDNPIIHSNYFALVDDEGRIRGFYNVYEDHGEKRRLINDVGALVKTMQAGRP